MIRKFSFITLVFVLSGLALGQAAGPSADISEFDINGLKVIVKKRASSPTVSAGLFVKGGVRNQKPEQAGIESLALSVASEGSVKFPRAVLRKELSRTGSVISGASGYDFGGLSLSSTRQHFDRTWEIFADVVLNPTFAQPDFEQVRDRFLIGLRDRDSSPDNALVSFEKRILFAGHPYAVDPSGTVETIQKITAADARAYYRSLLETSRLLLVIVGDVDPVAFEKRVTASFGRLPRGSYKQEPIQPFVFESPTLDVAERSLPTNYVKGVFAAPPLGHPEHYAMRVATTILQSRVYEEVRTRRNLSYAPTAEMDNSGANTAHIYVTAVDANQAVSVMLNEIARMKRETMETEQYEGIPGYFLTTYYIQQETNAAQVGELARYELIGGGWRRSLAFLDNIQKVTPADVRNVANKYMKNIRFVVIGDPKAIDRPVFLRN